MAGKFEFKSVDEMIDFLKKVEDAKKEATRIISPYAGTDEDLELRMATEKLSAAKTRIDVIHNELFVSKKKSDDAKNRLIKLKAEIELAEAAAEWSRSEADMKELEMNMELSRLAELESKKLEQESIATRNRIGYLETQAAIKKEMSDDLLNHLHREKLSQVENMMNSFVQDEMVRQKERTAQLDVSNSFTRPIGTLPANAVSEEEVADVELANKYDEIDLGELTQSAENGTVADDQIAALNEKIARISSEIEKDEAYSAEQQTKVAAAEENLSKLLEMTKEFKFDK